MNNKKIRIIIHFPLATIFDCLILVVGDFISLSKFFLFYSGCSISIPYMICHLSACAEKNLPHPYLFTKAAQ